MTVKNIPVSPLVSDSKAALKAARGGLDRAKTEIEFLLSVLPDGVKKNALREARGHIITAIHSLKGI